MKLNLKLKSKQVDVYEGKDAFVWLPTGYGKSICYQALPFVFDYKLERISAHPTQRSVVIVVSPLVSLMVDQVSRLQKEGFFSAAVLSGNHGVDKKSTASVEDILQGKFNLLYSAPEAIIGVERWRQMLMEKPLSEQIVAVIVDEVHCVYKW